MRIALFVALGAALGAPARFWVSHAVGQRERGAPGGADDGGQRERPAWVATLIVNVVGSFILGLALGSGITQSWAAMVGVGFCGAFTTFSTLALELWSGFSEERAAWTLAYAAASLALGCTAAYLGLALMT